MKAALVCPYKSLFSISFILNIELRLTILESRNLIYLLNHDALIMVHPSIYLNKQKGIAKKRTLPVPKYMVFQIENKTKKAVLKRQAS